QRDTLADRLKKLEKSKLAEQADVDRLEGHSLATFFYQVIGKMDEKLDKERQEAYAARVKYDVALHDLSSVDADLEQIQNRLARLSDCERQYQAALSEKIKSIKASAHPAAQLVAESESRIAALKVQKRELLEAINAGKTALHTVNEVLETLDNAEGWSTWDVMGGGLMADLAKYEELDNAQEQVEQLQVELRRFKTELADVEITADLQVTVDSFLKFADFFFDGLFADWAVLDHINQAQSRVENTKGQIKRVLHLPVPDAKFETVVVKPSEIQQDMVQALSERAAEVHSGSVDPSVDNMLKITSDGRKIGLDQRLMNSALPDDPNSKLNACVNNVLRIWNDTKEQKLTQLIFCDMSTPKGDGSFNVYDDIRTKLLNAGVPEQEIEFIHNADTENKKAELFSKVRSGQVRVLLGSTAKMGAGTNVQTLLVAVHHLDVGWRPSDMTQRNGRIIRQGNQNKQVYVYNYVTESTFDAYLYQTLENKQKFISQIMTSKSPMRSCDDIDEQALSYAEIKALCAGDPRIREKMDLDVQVAKLKVLRGDFQNQKYRLEDKLLKTFPEEIQKQKTRIAALQQDSQIAAAHPQDKENFCGMTIKGMVYDDKKAAGERLLLARQEMPNADMMLLGTYRGFELNIRFDSFKNEHQAVLRAELSYPVSLGDDARGNITRLDNAIDNFADRIADAENALQNLEQQKQAAEVEVAKPFAQEEELAEKSARLAELNALLNIDRDRSSSQDAPEETEETETPATRPSVLAALEEKVNQPEPVKPFKSYLDKEGR
ncbi:MAG: helicase-related protein, partial [Faecalibacterium prausnitzii]